MTRQEIQELNIGQKSVWPWNREYLVCHLGPVKERKGKVSRLVVVDAFSYKIKFIAKEE